MLYSHYRRKILNTFCRTMFNCHRTMVESGELDSEFSQLYFFLSSLTDRSEEISQYLENVNTTPIDIKQNQLNVWAQNGVFNPAKLDLYGESKIVMAEAVLSCLMHMCNISNSNLVRNADGLLCRRKEDVSVGWIG